MKRTLTHSLTKLLNFDSTEKKKCFPMTTVYVHIRKLVVFSAMATAIAASNTNFTCIEFFSHDEMQHKAHAPCRAAAKCRHRLFFFIFG